MKLKENIETPFSKALIKGTKHLPPNAYLNADFIT